MNTNYEYEYEEAPLNGAEEVRNDISINMVKASITRQIEEPVTQMTTDFLAPVRERIETAREDYSHDAAVLSELNEMEDDLCELILDKLDDRFDFGMDLENLTNMRKNEVAEVLYRTFVLNFKKNIRRYIMWYIKHNREELAKEYTTNTDKRSVGYIVIKKKTKDKEIITIISNLADIIRNILEIGTDPEHFIETVMEEDSYEGFEITSLLNNCNITSNFTNAYFDICLRNTDVLDEIYIDIYSKLISKLK